MELTLYYGLKEKNIYTNYLYNILKMSTAPALPERPWAGDNKIVYLLRQPIGCIPPFPSLAEGVVDMSTYEEFMIILTACSLLVAILNFTHRK